MNITTEEKIVLGAIVLMGIVLLIVTWTIPYQVDEIPCSEYNNVSINSMPSRCITYFIKPK